MNKSKALFLDRDGVINKDFGYVYKPDNLIILDGVFDLCQKAKQLDYKLIIVTNQSGIGRGYYTEEDFWLFMDAIHLEFAKYELIFDGIYFSPYHPDAVNPKYKFGKELRKPDTGMILQAQKDFNINLSQSVLIGDKITDIQAGMKAGVGRNILITNDVSCVIL